MVENMEMPKQFDNLNIKVVDDLKITLRRSSKVSIAAARRLYLILIFM